MTYNDIYTIMNDILRGTASDNIDKKTRAFYEGFKELIVRMANMNKIPGEMRAEEYLATTISTHVAPLPSDYLTYQRIWKLVGSNYQKFEDEEILTLQKLQDECGTNFNDTSDTGTPNYLAIDGDQLVFDKHWEADGTTAIKLSYYKYPAEVTAYDQLDFTGASGTFTVGETITGSSSNATATVKSDNTTSLYVTSSSVIGTFISGETITGSSSTETATLSSAISQKVQTLELGEKYKFALANAGASMYMYLEGSIEAQEKDAVLDNIIKEIGVINKSGNIRIRPSV